MRTLAGWITSGGGTGRSSGSAPMAGRERCTTYCLVSMRRYLGYQAVARDCSPGLAPGYSIPLEVDTLPATGAVFTLGPVDQLIPPFCPPSPSAQFCPPVPRASAPLRYNSSHRTRKVDDEGYQYQMYHDTRAVNEKPKAKHPKVFKV